MRWLSYIIMWIRLLYILCIDVIMKTGYQCAQQTFLWSITFLYAKKLVFESRVYAPRRKKTFRFYCFRNLRFVLTDLLFLSDELFEQNFAIRFISKYHVPTLFFKASLKLCETGSTSSVAWLIIWEKRFLVEMVAKMKAS